ncbi:tail tape measure protein [Zoogloea oryzae]|uniref:Tail tape measure protein n=1 Tax=Zoogloea oryzae TaxID=310767 RepID=A0ABQ6FBW7_9RHOO|nr:phage tail tape measure protein [Zoogloea oryzae]GLT22697.1 tail tape measure protein [Zoogloea oryzae]
MSDATTKVGIVFTATDGSAAGLKAVEQAVKKAADVAVEGSSKTALAAKDAALKSTQAVQAAHDTHVRLYRDMANARETLGIRAERTVRQEIQQTQAAYQTLARSGALSAREMARAQDATLAKVRELKRELGEVSRLQRMEQIGQAGAAGAAGAAVAYRVANNPITAAKDLETAQADLRIALMRKGGVVPEDAYKEIMRQAVALGNSLPGSTKDFVSAATALSEQGMPLSAITGGGLTASAQFGVLAKMDQYQSATSIAKMREAYGLADGDLPEMANLMQKAKNAYGIAPDDFRAVAQYAAPTYNTLGLTGKENARDLLAVQGIAASVGLENTSFGTNFAMMLSRTSQIDARLGGKGEAAKEAREVLSKHGIDLNFYGKDGKFKGLENMFSELDKLKPLTDIDRMHVLDKLFGVEASRPASIMIQKGGLQAFRESRAKLDEQADIGPRIAQKTSTLASKEEAAGGTWENTKATAAKGLAETKGQALDTINDGLTAVQPVLEKYPGLGTGAITAGALGAGAATSWASLRMLQGVMGTGAGLRAVSSIPGIATASSLAARLPVIPKGVGLGAIGASLGGAVLSSMYGEESTAARYGSAALSGAGMGATLGSVVPILGTGVGAAGGAALGMAIQGISDLLKKDPKPTNVKADIRVGLAPGLVLQGQTVETNGPAGVKLDTGNIWSGAPQ